MKTIMLLFISIVYLGAAIRYRFYLEDDQRNWKDHLIMTAIIVSAAVLAHLTTKDGLW